MNANELIEAYVDDVVRQLGRKQRNDVGVELRALLGEELQMQVEVSGRPADEAMAMELLRRFGRPTDVAGRYRNPGFPIIEAADAPGFVRLAAIGMVAVWIVGLVSTFREGGAGLEGLGAWWMTWGLAAFWWPGFLVVIGGVATWIRRRFPIADDWKPRAIDRDRVSRVWWVLAIVFFSLGVVWLASPSQIVEQLSGGRLAAEFYGYFVYDDTFRQWRLPVLLPLLVAHLVLYVVLVVEGRWRRLTRRIDMTLSLLISGLLIWSLLAGPIFQAEVGNRAARNVIWPIVLIALVDVAVKFYREQSRVRMPRSLAN